MCLYAPLQKKPLFLAGKSEESMQVDVKVSQLLCSRLCHDLVGAASAINAGLEMIRDDPGDPEGPLDLMEGSASQMTRRLAFFRVAFGLAEGPKGPANVGFIRDLAAGWLEGGKVALNWPDTETHGSAQTLSAEVAKVCLNLVMTTSECLPRGGEIYLHLTKIPAGTGIGMEAKGVGARVSEDMASALRSDASLDQLNAHNAHVFYAQSLARSSGAEIEYQIGEGGESIQLAVLFPNR
jgi:histidine phosphotransferase ChpT